MRTVETLFANNFDFYMSFGIGLGLAIGLIGVWHVVRSFGRMGACHARQPARPLPAAARPGRHQLLAVDRHLRRLHERLRPALRLARAVLPVVFFLLYGFVYTPLISYITARMEGIAGQFVSLPLVREASFIAGAKYFGYHGIEIWYAPIPIHNYGGATVGFREIELTGTSIRGIIKSEIVVFPVVMVASLLFSQFIWRLAPIPSSAYPYAQELWHLQALNSLLMQTSTLEGNSLFFQALNWIHVGAGTALGVGCLRRADDLRAPGHAGLRAGAGPRPERAARVDPGGRGRAARALLLPAALRGHVAPVLARAPGRVLLRHGAERHVRHGGHADPQVADEAAVLKDGFGFRVQGFNGLVQP